MVAPCLVLAFACLPAPAGAVLDVENRGPQLTAGGFAMRVTNIGVLGNPFFAVGRSFDPSFEFPRGSGIEYMNRAELWVGARDPSGRRRVSGGPMLEWRPTLDPADHVRTAYAGNPGTLRWFDDDGDGRVDEEFLDGSDDDADGEVDEDLGLFATQTLFARYTDDQPEAVNYPYPNGERHQPLHLAVQQKVFTWAAPGYDQVAGLHFVITNRGNERLTDLHLGMAVDLDVREAGSAGAHLDDEVRSVGYEQFFNDGQSSIRGVLMFPPPPSEPLPYVKFCLSSASGFVPAIGDPAGRRGRAAVAVVPLRHTTDPLGILSEQGRVSDAILRRFITAPLRVSFRQSWYANDLSPLEGGLPIVDEDRYRALAGEYPTVPDTSRNHDYVALVACGPFPFLDPGHSLEMELAFVVAEPESLSTAAGRAVQVHHGTWVNVLADTTTPNLGRYDIGKSGYAGHEICYEPPAGLEFIADPHCVQRYIPDPVGNVDSQAPYSPGHCVWSDLDCDVCTGFDGRETRSHWLDPAGVPLPPAWRTRPGDRAITVEWDDRSEVLQDVHLTNPANVTFLGYNLYRLDQWSTRRSDIPTFDRFQQVAAFARDTTLGARTLASVTDSTLAYDRILYERRVHPIGRYRWTDHNVRNGFDYVYVVTAVSERLLQVRDGLRITERLESPLLAALDSVVTPRVDPRARAGGVHVVPNPYRGRAPWERPPVPGDVLVKHVDFVGLPAGRSVVRIYTLAGDLVQRIDHDGQHGGEARWNLISRNGQDVASGVYLFTVESSVGHQVGRFVILR